MSRDVPIFVQFHRKIGQLMKITEKKNCKKKKGRFGQKKYKERKVRKREHT